MALISISGVDLPAPSSLKVTMADLDSSDATRNEEGILQRDRIRQGVYKIELSFEGKKGSDIQLIESALLPSKLNVTFPDTTGFITKEMYVGDRNKDMVIYREGDNVRWNMSFNLIEY